MLDLLLRGARLLDGQTADIGIRAGHVVDLAARLEQPAAQEIDLAGSLVTRGFVDAHVHLDKAFLWDDPTVHGTIRGEASEALRQVKRRSSAADIRVRMQQALDLAVRNGTTTLTAQIEIDELVGLRGLEAALDLRQTYADRLDLRIVAFPQEGLLTREGVPELFRHAASMGIHAVGGAPAFDHGHAEHLAFVFQLAAEHDLDVDLHVDLSTPPERPLSEWELVQAAALVGAHGYRGRVSVAHLQALSRMLDQRPLLELLLEHLMSVVTVPGAELHLAATWRDPPATDPRTVLTDVHALLRAGVRVHLGTGHVRDPLNPYGNASVLGDLSLLCAAVSLGEPALGGRPALELVLPRPPAISVGQEADLVALPVADAALAVRHHPTPSKLFKGSVREGVHA